LTPEKPQGPILLSVRSGDEGSAVCLKDNDQSAHRSASRCLIGNLTLTRCAIAMLMIMMMMIGLGSVGWFWGTKVDAVTEII
jgi:hypothetical protein